MSALEREDSFSGQSSLVRLCRNDSLAGRWLVKVSRQLGLYKIDKSIISGYSTYRLNGVDENELRPGIESLRRMNI